MFEIIKTLLVSLSFAATGAGIAWSVTSGASEPIAGIVVESGSDQATKGDRLDIPSTKGDRLPTLAVTRSQDAVVIVYANASASSTIYRAPLVVASAR
jgi:hypothetical protein